MNPRPTRSTSLHGAALTVALAACAGSTSATAPAHAPPLTRPTAAAPVAPPPVTTALNHESEVLRRDVPAAVAPGQSVAFGLDVVDEEEDPVRVELGAHPEGAELDPRTLTVRWTVPLAMSGPQRFTLRITERPGQPDARTVERALEVRVERAEHAAALADDAPRLVGALVTITAPAYLSRAASEWPIERVLERARDAAIDALPVAQQPSIALRTGAELFRDLLTHYAAQHQNARLDPASASFDRRFEAARWRLVAVRPRVNKHVEELRLVYQAVEVPEPVFAMFRFRLFRGATPPSPAIVAANNAAFTGLVHAAFFQGGAVKPGIAAGQPAVVAPAVASLVRSVLTFRDANEPLLRAGLVAIPEEARMGGGSAFDPAGNYVSGNAWAFTVANIAVDPPAPAAGTPSARSVRVIAAPVSSFAFDIAPDAAGETYACICPPPYRPDNPAGLGALCAADGTVRIRERTPAGTWTATRRDALAAHADVTAHEMLAHVALRDPRRRNFEENGMTCVQCHIRNFDDGVLSEAQVADPRMRAPITPAREIARVALQIVPTPGLRRSPWLVQQETFQLCDLGRHLREQLHVTSELPCPEGY